MASLPLKEIATEIDKNIRGSSNQELEKLLDDSANRIGVLNANIWEKTRELQEQAFKNRIASSELKSRAQKRKRKFEEDLQETQRAEALKSKKKEEDRKKVSKDLLPSSTPRREEKREKKEEKGSEKSPRSSKDPPLGAVERAIARANAKYAPPVDKTEEGSKSRTSERKKAEKEAASASGTKVTYLTLRDLTESDEEPLIPCRPQKPCPKPLPDPAKEEGPVLVEKQIRESQELEHEKRALKPDSKAVLEQALTQLLGGKQEGTETDSSPKTGAESANGWLLELVKKLGATQDLTSPSRREEN